MTEHVCPWCGKSVTLTRPCVLTETGWWHTTCWNEEEVLSELDEAHDMSDSEPWL